MQMRHINIYDIHKRLNGLQTANAASNSFTEAVHSIITDGRPNDIKRFIENGVQSGQIIPFHAYMELYDALIDKGSVSDINKIGSFIESEVIVKTRDAKQTQTLLKRKLGNIKRKMHSKVSSSIEDASAAFKTTPVTKQSTFKYTQAKQEAALNAYESMLETAIIMSHCDRVIENYNKVSKRFNLELLFNENTRVNGTKDTVLELCHMIDTYQMPTEVKFNTVIESALYGFESNGIEFSKSDILEVASDYFAFKEDGVKACNEILDATLFFDKNEDMGNVDILTEEEPEEDIKNENSALMRGSTVPYMYVDGMEIDLKSVKESSDTNDDTDFDKIFKKFKKDELAKDPKPQNKLKYLVSKLYSRSVDGVIQGTPKLLNWVRSFFILGSCTIPMIGPVIMVIGFIADKFIGMHMERKEVEQMIKCFTNEIKTSKTKLESLKDEEEKEKMTKYIESLEKAKTKIEDYYDGELLTTDEVSARYEKMYADNENNEDLGDIGAMSDKELEDFMNSDDDDFDLSEFMEFAVMDRMATSIEDLTKFELDQSINDRSMYSLIYELDNDNLTSVAVIASKYPEVFYKEDVKDAITDSISDIRSGKIQFNSTIDKALRLNELHQAKDLMDTTEPEMTPVTIYEAEEYLTNVSEAYKAVSIMINAASERDNPLLEASITNALRMASMKLRNAMKKMSDKERNISRSIDVGANNLTKGVEKALTNDNRESIIKGSILPSASKLLKLGIANAGLIAIGQPVLAAIGTIGYLGVSAKFKAKERQMLVDEIEIELKMCQKYIDIAEQKNDMKALKQLLMIQRDLERQHQRIKYKMKAELGQKYYDAKHVGDQ